MNKLIYKYINLITNKQTIYIIETCISPVNGTPLKINVRVSGQKRNIKSEMKRYGEDQEALLYLLN